jgi:hypothetical protein
MKMWKFLKNFEWLAGNLCWDLSSSVNDKYYCTFTVPVIYIITYSSCFYSSLSSTVLITVSYAVSSLILYSTWRARVKAEPQVPGSRCLFHVFIHLHSAAYGRTAPRSRNVLVLNPTTLQCPLGVYCTATWRDTQKPQTKFKNIT